MSRPEGYDYIIVGAGSAGCVLANRLSEDPAISVCLIEAGKQDNSLLIRMPAGVGKLLSGPNKYNWGFWTAPQSHMGGRKLWWPRGKGWGGSSSINGMLYTRGHAQDYDQWRQSGLIGWGYSDVLPYFRKSEGYEGGETDYHGGNGPLKVTDSAANTTPFGQFLKAGAEAGYPYNEDFNGAEQYGVGPYQRTIFEGERWSVSRGYLQPIVDERPNLTVMSTALVSRVIFRGGEALGVETVAKRGAQPKRVYANQEVILCAGAVQSPQILMLSGIGPAEQIRAQGITSITDLPGVGQNLQDHLDISVIHRMTEKVSVHSIRKGFGSLSLGLRYLWNKSGPGATNFLEAGGFVKTRDGLDRPDIQLHIVNAIVVDHGAKNVRKDGFTLHTCQLRPESRGSVTLESADPFEAPRIDPNYLATETDRIVMRDSVKLVRDLCAQQAFSKLRGPEFLPGKEVQSDAEIDGYIRDYAETIYHPVGTVHMGIHDDAPLDPELKVRGVEGLRVVDASVMPTLIGGNTNAPTVMIAEKAADLILGKEALPRAEL